MLTIQLKDLHFRSFHGVYAEETRLGADYILNISVQYEPPGEVVRHLEQTLNYERIFELARRRMSHATPLLETVAMEIAGSIMDEFRQACHVWVSLQKCHPPIEGMEGSVAVCFEKSRQD